MHQVKTRSSWRLVAFAGLALVGLAVAGCRDTQDTPFAPEQPRGLRPSFNVPPGSGNWTTLPSMPTPRADLAAGVINGILYTVGGVGPFISTAVEAYDPVTSTWTTKAPMPVPLIDIAAGVVNGILYRVGGETNGGVFPTSVDAYDPTSNSWTPKAPMPTPRAALRTGVINGILYAVGGIQSGGGSVATVEAYDPSTNSWTTKAPMPTARWDMTIEVINGILYAVGGATAGGVVVLPTVEAYDPVTDTWTSKAPMPTARFGLASGVLNGALYAVGGINGSTLYSTVERYDPVSNAWTTAVPMPTARYLLGAGVVNSTLYAVGGSTNPSSNDATNWGKLEAFTLKADQTITFGSLGNRTFGDPQFAVNATASSGLPVTFSASGNCTAAGSTVSLTGAGNCTITADQAGNASFNAAPSVAQSFSIAKATPVIAWTAPAPIVYGTALSGTQLNATATGVGGANLTGTFTYSPPAGTVLTPGQQTLAVSFTPTDAANYNGGAKTVPIAVLYNTAVGHVFLEPLEPLAAQPPVFGIGSAIPVKFKLFLADGVTLVSTAVATIQVNKVINGVPSSVNEPVASTDRDVGISFEYDAVRHHYIFNLRTKGWSAGVYRITALLDDGSRITADVRVRIPDDGEG